MPEHNGSEEFHHHASQVRLIAEGLFDHTKRRIVLQFVDDCEKRITIDEREKAGDRTRKEEITPGRHSLGTPALG
jgi:hypothetical protein